MKHLTRDFLTISSASSPGTNMYALSIFLVGCGGYSLVGQTNFNVSSGSFQVAGGSGASINLITSSVYVAIPSSTHLVSSADLNRILVLKSTTYPTFNSGLFRVNGIDLGTNAVKIDYRTSTSPPSESDLNWGLFVDEITASVSWRSGVLS